MRHSAVEEKKPPKLAGQVCKQLDILRSPFYEPNACISSQLEKQ